jgi:hypothetical protein
LATYPIDCIAMFCCVAQHPKDPQRTARLVTDAPDIDCATTLFFELLNSFYITGAFIPYRQGHTAGQYLVLWKPCKRSATMASFAFEALSAEDAHAQLKALAEDGQVIAPHEPI